MIVRLGVQTTTIALAVVIGVAIGLGIALFMVLEILQVDMIFPAMSSFAA